MSHGGPTYSRGGGKPPLTRRNPGGVAPAWTFVAGGLSATVDQASEQDLAQAISRLKTKAVAQASQTDAAQAITARKTYALGQVSETNTAQAITRLKTRTVAQASESDTAQAITSRKTLLLGMGSGEITEDFSSLSTGDDLDTLSPWTKHGVEGGNLIKSASGGIVSGDAATGPPPSVSADGVYRYGSGTWADDQWVEWTHHSAGGGSAFIGGAVRVSTDGDCYALIIDGSNVAYLNTYTNGEYTGPNWIGSGIGAVDGSLIRLEVIGTTANVYVDGGLAFTTGGLTHWTSGNPGAAVFTAAAAGTARITNWRAYGIEAEALASETDTAQSITVLKARTLAQALEADTSQSITVNPQRRLLNAASESDAAQAITSRKTAALAQASETDAAQTVSISPYRRLLNAASEQDTSQAITSRKTKALAQASETDLAQSITSRKVAALAQSSEQDAAQAITARKIRTLAQALESDTSQSISVSPIRRLLSAASEQDAAQTISLSIIRLLSAASEQDLAQTIANAPYRRLLNQVSESDTAQTVSVSPYRRLLQQAAEQDAAQAFTSRKVQTLSQASESDAAQSLTSRKLKLVAQSAETDAAQAITATRLYTLAQASEADNAQSVTSRKLQLVQQAAESDTSQAMASSKLRAVGQAQEQDESQEITTTGNVLIGAASEQDAAQAATAHKFPPDVEPAFEMDLAQALLSVKRLAIGQVEELDNVFSISSKKRLLVSITLEADLAQTITAVLSAAGGISAQHRIWLEALARAHGLIDVLTVTRSGVNGTRTDSTLSQQYIGNVLTTLMLPDGSQAATTSQQEDLIEALARVHGLVDPLTVTESNRTDGTFNQNIVSDDTTAVYTRTA